MEKNEKIEVVGEENNNELKTNEIIVPVLEEAKKKLTFLDVLGKLSPGKSLRVALDDILEGESGALIVAECDELRDLIDGGFRINTKFTPQKLAELAKMDGAIILSSDMKRVLLANALLVPDSKIPTNETGTRHKAAERTAKQTGTIVIAVSERRSKITLFYEDKKYVLENSEHLLRRATETLHILEKQREIFDDILKNLNILEVTQLVSAGDVCSVLQRVEVIIKMMDTMKRYLTELGNQGIIIRMSVRKIFETSPDTQLIPRGFRLLEKLNLTEREVKGLIGEFDNLSNILEANPEEINKILKARTENFKKEMDSLKEQILLGKKV